jgi:3-oxoadipate enol-lactonase
LLLALSTTLVGSVRFAMPRFVTDDGIGLSYEIWGHGDPTLLYVPAWDDHFESMRWSEPLAERGLGIVAYERRGTGRSDRPRPNDDNYTVERLGADAIALADNLGYRRLVPIAHFDGAHQAVRLAAERPELIVGLVLMGPLLAPIVERPMQVMWEGLITRGMGYALRSVADLGMAGLPEDEREQWARSHEGHIEGDVLLAMWRSTDVAESRPFVDRVRCPAIVLAGQRDLAIPMEWSSRVAERLPNGRLVELSGAGAAMWLTNAAEMRAAILEFTRDL